MELHYNTGGPDETESCDSDSESESSVSEFSKTSNNTSNESPITDSDDDQITDEHKDCQITTSEMSMDIELPSNDIESSIDEITEPSY